MLSAAYPAAYGQFQQALAQHATLLPTGQKEGELKGKYHQPLLTIFISGDRAWTDSHCWRPMLNIAVERWRRSFSDVNNCAASHLNQS